MFAAVLLACAAAAPADRPCAQSAPAKPTGLTAEDGNTQVRLRWTGPNDPTITHWHYAREPAAAASDAWTDMPGSGPATRRYTVTGLKNNRTYRFRIRAVNAAGPGRWSDEATGQPYPAFPAKPAGFRALPGDRAVMLIWDHADDASIQGWEFRQKEANGNWGHWAAVPGSDADTVGHTVGGLENGAGYAFQIRAFNSAGNGRISDQSEAVPMPAAPGKPTGFSVEAGNRKAVLAWDDPGNDTILKWQYAYRTVGEVAGWTDMAGSGARTVRHTISLLENGAAYTFRIRAVNEIGPGPGSDEVSAVPRARPPEQPAGLRARAGDKQVALSWTDPADASILGWQYAYRTTGNYGPWTDIPGSHAALAGHIVAGLANGTAHIFKIRAVNEAGAGPESGEASATPLAVPAKPAGLTAAAGDARAVLAWADPLNATVTGWQYSYRTAAGYGPWIGIPGSSAATTSHTVPGLANGVEHNFRIRAVNASGPGAESDSAAATPRPVPAKPAGLRAEAGNTQARLIWTDPGDNSIAGWQYRYRTAGDDGAWTGIPGSNAATTRYTVTGLANDTAYAFRIRAVNGSGAGAESDEASATPREGPPEKPTGFEAGAGDGQVVLTWDDPDDSSIQAWQFKSRAAGGDYGPYAQNIPGSGAKTVRHVVAGLENGRTYYFILRAVNAANGWWSDERSAAPRSLRPAAPTGLDARAGDGFAALQWAGAGDATITGWQYAVKTTGGYGPWTDIPGSGAATTAHTVTGLKNGASYTFKLRAVNSHGGGAESEEVSAAPLAVPARPAGFSAMPGDGQAMLAWDDPGNTTITGWQYAIGTAGDYSPWTGIPGSSAATTAHTVTGLDNGASYTFKLRAHNASGNGAESDEATAIPVAVPARPAGFSATPGDGQISLQWTGADDATITGWQYRYRTEGSYGPWMDIPGSGATTTTHIVTGLENGTAYTFKLRAINASGNGTESDEATATPVAVPAKPAGLSAMPGDGQVSLQWTDPEDATITGWQYAIGTADGYGPWTGIPGSSATTTAHIVTGLENGTAYTFKLRAHNASGNGAESDEATAIPVAVPAKPTGFSAMPGDGQISLQWTGADDATITGWQYRYKTAGGYGPWTDIPGSGATTTTHTMTGLDNDTSYTFRLRAVNASGNGSESDEATATPVAVPAKPMDFTATPGDGQVVLSWNNPGNATITDWQYRYRTEGDDYDPWISIPGSGAATTTHTVTGLENGTAYSFRLRAMNASGNGAESNEATATPVAVPAKPAGFSATPGDGQISLQWTTPNNATITGWQYHYRTEGGGYGPWTGIPGSSATTTAHTVTGLENGTAYTFKLRAINTSGNGAESNEATAIPVAVPAKPTGFTATPGDAQVSLQWSDLNDTTITGWQYAMKTTGGYGPWTGIPGSGAATTSHTVAGLDNGTAYTFKLRAQNASGNGAESHEATAIPVAVPAKPAGFSATPRDGQVVLSWNDPNDATITGWQYAVQTTGSYSPWTGIPGGGPTTTAHTVTGLENGTAYTFRLRAQNASGNGAESDEATATPVAVPAKPAGFSATPGHGQVSLKWTDPDDATITGWQYAMKTTGSYGPWTGIPGGGPTTTAHTVTGLENGTAYNFKLRAVNASGNGAESDEATAIPVPVPDKPAGFSATPGDGQVSLKWTDPDDATITGWQYRYRTEGDYGPWTGIPGSGATTTAHTVTGLENGTAYTFNIRAHNASGNGTESNEAIAIPVAIPATPTGFTVTPGDGLVSLQWTGVDDATITGWQYRYKTEGGYGPWTDISGSGPTTTAHIVTGLENGIAHTFKLRAHNASGNGAESDEATATPVAVPARPAGFSATPGDGQVSLQWNDPNDATITGWQYRYKTEGGYGPWTGIPGSGAATTSHIVTGLENRTAYTFKLRAVNASGNGAESDEATAIPVPVPARPAGFSAVPGDGQVVLSWNDPNDAIITGWQYAVKTTGSYGPWISIPGSGAATTSHTVAGLENGTTYSFKLRAVNASGNGAESDEATTIPVAVPDKPAGFSATPGDGRISLQWTDPDDTTIMGWQYRYRTEGNSYGPWTNIPGSGAATTSHIVAGLDNGVSYTFKLRAINASGNGAESNAATAIPVAVPAKPAGFSTTPGDGQVSLKWTDPDDATITGWQYAMKTTGSYGPWTGIPGGGPTTTAHTVTGLENGTTYTFKLHAINASGNGAESDEATATPVAVPAKPAGFSATPGDGLVSLQWTDPDDVTITGWQYAIGTAGGYGPWTGIPGGGSTTTAHIVISLDNGTAYTFKLRAHNASGNGAESDEVTTTPVAVPAKPTGFSAMPGDGQVSLQWTDPDDATITGWQYRYKTEDSYGPWTGIPGGGPTTTAHTVTGLENGASYTFMLLAHNASGNGAESDEVTATPIPVPAKPAGFSATSGDGQVSLQWSDPNDATITGWQYRYRTEGDYGPWTGIPGGGAGTTGHIVTGLENGASYTFKLRAVNASGNGAESDEATATPVPVPAKPTGFSAMPGDGQVVLSWNDLNDATIAGWEYNLRRAGGEFEADWTYILGSSDRTTSYTVTGLDNGTAYTFKLRAINASGNGAESDEATATPVAVPAKPAGFTATAGAGQVVLSWNDPNDATIAGWEYNQRRAGGAFEADWTYILGSTDRTTSYTVTGLDNGTAYTFKLRAHNASGNGAESDEATAIPVAAPAKPTGFSATPGDGQISLQWSDPNDATITGWQYRYKTEDGYSLWTSILGSGAATTSHTLAGLGNGVSYTFKLRAINASGNGAESDEATATPVAVPAKPAGFTATAGAGQVVLSWNDSNDATITGWQYRYRTEDSYGPWTGIPGSNVTTTSHTVTGLDNGTAYTFKLRAINASGNGAESDEAAATPVAVPARPAGFTVTAGAGHIVLSWNDPNDATITGWQYRYKTEGGGYGPWTGIPGGDPTTTAHTVTGLDNGASYTFKLRAVNASGTGAESDEATATPVAVPARPVGFFATPGDGQVSLQWSDPNDATITGWQYRYKTENGSYSPWTGIPGSGAATASYIVTGLDNGAPYAFKIRAVNASGNGVVSDEETAIPVAVPAKPVGFTATAGAGQVVLSWNDPNGATITGWQYRYRTEDGDYGPWTGIPGSGAATTSHIVIGLDNGMAYTFKLRAVNASGNGAESDEATAIPVAIPAKPTGFTATPGDGQVVLSWNDPGNATITDWQYRYRTEGGDYGPWTGTPESGPTTTAHTVTGLDNGTAYTFKLRAMNTSGNGAESDEATATPVSVPAKPAGFIATPGDGQVSLQWTTPNDATITGWQYRYKTEGGGYSPWTGIPGSGPTTTAHTVTSLDNGTSYTFKLRAVNASGNGAESDEATAIPVAVPAKPAGFTTTPGDGQVSLQWADPDDATITGWQYAVQTTGGYGPWTGIPGSDANTTAYTVTGLDNSATYTFKLRAHNASGNGAESDEATAVPVAVPAKPAGLSATPGDGQVSLQWTDPDDATITGWQYRYKTEDSYGPWTGIPGSGATTTAHTVTGLDNGTAYTFKLRAINTSGNGAESDEATATPIPVPAKPASFSATPGDGQVVLSWNDPSDATITGWQYAVQTTGGYSPWTGIPGSSAATTSHTVAGLDNGTTYTFKLRAHNTSGNGAESDEATAIPVAVPVRPAGFSATPRDRQVVLSWNDPNDATITGWQYAVKKTGAYGPWIGILGSGATTTTHTVDGLNNGASYTFKLRAINASGNGAESDEATATPVAVPARPAGFSVTPGDGQILLQWSDPNDKTITGWQYTVKTRGGYGPWIDIPGSDAITTTHIVTDLENGTAYTFKLRAMNTSGNGAESDEATAIPVAVPAKPAGFSAMPGDGQVSLQWSTPNDATITGWQYRYRTEDGDYGPWTGIPGSGAATTSHTVAGLDNGTAYTFKLRAQNASGNGAESHEATAIPVAVPAKPAGFSGTPRDGQVVLSWNDPNDATITGWQYAVQTTGSYSPWTGIPRGGPTTTAHTVTGLDNGTAYTFKLRAQNASGNGAESDEATAIPVAVPARPAGFSAMPGDGQVSLQWADPEDATITDWQYAIGTAGGYGPWTNIPGSGAATTSHTVVGLDNGTAYTFKLRAHNASGNGAESGEATATPVPVPAKPAGFTATPGDGQVVLSWNDPSDATITGWQYAVQTTGGYGPWIGIPGSSATTTSHIVTGLDNGTAYTFKLHAMNASGNGAESDEATATPVAIPAKPAGFTATAGAGQVVLSWNDPDDATIAGWEYSQRRAGGEFEADWTYILGSSDRTTSYTVTGLDNGTAYTFKLRAVNASGNGAESDEATATPAAAPAKPAGFFAMPGDGLVSLQWTDPDDATITGWQYAVQTTGGYGPWAGIPGSSAATTSHTVTGLDNGTAYTFKLRAHNASGNGAESDEATATPVAVPARPTGFSATPGDRRVSLQWAGADDATITLWQYAVQTTGSYGPWTDIPGSSAKTTAHTVDGLNNGASYTFKVRAINASGNGAESDEATATPAAVPAKPAGFTAKAGAGEVVLSWNDPNDATITGWQYRYKTEGGGYGLWTGIPGGDPTTTAHTVTGLDNGASYTFKLRAVNASGIGAESDEATAAPVAVPAKPSGFSAMPGDGRVSLRWSDLNDATITGWQYAVKTTGGYGPWTNIPGSSAVTTSHIVTSLDNGAFYTFKLRAINASGNGAESDEVTATPVAVPAKPAGFTATAGAGEVVLLWNDPNDATITGWQYRYRTEGGYGPWTDIPGSGAATTSHTVTGLDNGTAYTFKLRAVNASGNGAESGEATAIPAAVPAKPAGFTATAGAGEVVLAWNDPNDATIAGWEYNQRRAGGEFEADWTYILGSTDRTTSYTVTGLDNGTAYTFKLRAHNASGIGIESDEATATPAAAPAKPAGFSATPGDGLVSLQWTDPDNATITGWQYAVKTTGGYGPWTGIPGSGATTTAHTVAGLDNGTAYTFKLRAINASGNGTESGEVTAIPVAVPAKPTGFSAMPGDGQVSLQWTDPDNATITGWQYAVQTIGGYGPWTGIPGSGATTTAYTVTGLDDGTAYTFKLRAHNASGNGAESDEATATPAAVPAKPTGFSVTPGDGLVSLQWTDPNDATITGWQYAVKTTGGYGPWTGIPGSSAATTSYTLTGLDNGASYTVKLRAHNASGDGAESDEATATPVAVPAKPAGFTATAGAGEVVLSWNDPNDATITGWQYRYRTEGGYGPWTVIPGSGAATTSHTVTGLDNGASYTFKLRAVNASGNGAESDEATAIPVAVPARPAGFTATAGDRQVVLSWNDPNDATIAGWEYNQRRAGGEFEADWTYILGSTDRTTSYTVTGLDNGTAYSFKLRAP